MTDYTTSGPTATSSGMMYIRIFSLVKIEVLKKCILTPKIIFVFLENVIDSDHIFLDLFSLMKF